jgi:predicted enzyme related to lactoylglutathione lyase
MGHPVVHFEIGCKNLEATEAFFSKLFGGQMERAGLASMIDTAGTAGIQGHITSLGHEPFHYTMF